LHLPAGADATGPMDWAARVLLGEGPGRFLVAVPQEQAEAWHACTRGASAAVTALGQLTDMPKLLVHVAWQGEERTVVEADLRPLVRDRARVWEAPARRRRPPDPDVGTVPDASPRPHAAGREAGTP